MGAYFLGDHSWEEELHCSSSSADPQLQFLNTSSSWGGEGTVLEEPHVLPPSPEVSQLRNHS